MRTDDAEVRLFDEDRIQVHVHGEPCLGRPQPRTIGGQPGERMKLIRREESESRCGRRIDLIYYDEETALEARSSFQFYGESPICRRWVTIANRSKEPRGLSVLYGAFIDNIPWQDDREQFLLHVPYSHNCAEGQWRVNRLPALGLAKSYSPNAAHVRFGALGRSSDVCLPMGMLEDTLNNWTFIWQIEHSGLWTWELGQTKGDFLYLAIGGLTESHGHWYKELAPNEEVVSLTVSAGKVEGDAERALAEMVDYRRAACRKSHPVDDACPVVFNDYLYCLRAKPSRDKSLPLIKRAAEAGCEVYMVDAGWYGNGMWQTQVGNWYEDRNKFPRGLGEVMDAIRQADMIPGLWIEIEAASITSELAGKPDSWFFTTHGKRNLFSRRYALDFRNPQVRDFASATMDRIIGDYGLGYVKIDYNMSVLLGTDRDSDSLGDGALEHSRALQGWYESLRQRHPDVIFENCASGGMRNDYAMLSILQLASSSDLSDYRLYPHVVVGSMAAILPEQLGVWSFPREGNDREEAVFNMTTAMLARIHQSGPINDISEEQFEIVREGIDLYKSEVRQDIRVSKPFYPLGRVPIEQTDRFIALGLNREDRHHAWLCVWRLNTREPVVSVPVPVAGSGKVSVQQKFPSLPKADYTWQDGCLTVELPRPYMARVFKISY